MDNKRSDLDKEVAWKMFISDSIDARNKYLETVAEIDKRSDKLREEYRQAHK